ncbi:MAG: 2,3-bisphosphoglycerate-independent phosphoglycerate mutase [Eubacteriales bacterium]|nr:2,3-bisphosphoglycerate-independent phosphoglycerate mutase [Eubacteriales bacterium]MDD3198712.1 2,3-bisphosphoglycerate-independent phosphoglycerate mutase [Eubacteriales bacterium]MDD4629042.1 2,3-bisphosphoglycerate-independent phosphoglycerate mutase [Eubacteriales bacterium]
MKLSTRPNLLMILDGYGSSSCYHGNAIYQANKKNIDRLFEKYPNTIIEASGLSVGLPEGQMGNSEVGHLNIGAGRIVFQELTRITKDIEDGLFFHNTALEKAVDHALANNSALHLLGLLSDGGVHSHINHLFALIDLAKQKGLKKLYIHALLDGRDVQPRCAATYIEVLEAYLKKAGIGKIALISGRYYGMDRDKRWDRVLQFYNAITLGEGEKAESAAAALANSYKRGDNDEFVIPTLICKDNSGPFTVQDNDAIIMFNFRPDRAREITRCFVDENFNGFNRTKVINNLCYVCMTQYDAEMPNVHVAYPPQSLKNTLGEYLSELGLRQLRIAETEKYAHVTFFFNGGIETPNNGEDRVLIPSPKVATYDLMPEMSAYQITDKVVELISENKYDVIILNYANPDMVGHTGNIDASINAIETLDKCVPRVVDAVLDQGGQVIITSDHGNADCMLDKSGRMITAHSLNPVPFLVMANEPVELRNDGILADITPTLLDLMGVEKPAEMTGRSLLIRK